MLNGCNVAELAAKEYRALLSDYILYLQTGWQHFSNQKISASVRLEKLCLLEKALRRNSPFLRGIIFRLQQSFVKENISITLLLEPLSAWRFLAAGKLPTSGTQVSEILNRLLSPLARLLLVLDNENPSTYQPLTSLFVLLFLQEAFNSNSDFVKKAKMSKRQKESRLNGLYKSAKVILSLLKTKRLKFRIAILLNTANLHTRLFKNNEQHNWSFLDYLSIFLYSLGQFLFIKRKSVNNKGI